MLKIICYLCSSIPAHYYGFSRKVTVNLLKYMTD